MGLFSLKNKSSYENYLEKNQNKEVKVNQDYDYFEERFGFEVEDIFDLGNNEIVAVGLINEGNIKLNENLNVQRKNIVVKSSKVERIEQFGKTLKNAKKGMYVGIVFKNIPKKAIKKGDILRK